MLGGSLAEQGLVTRPTFLQDARKNPILFSIKIPMDQEPRRVHDFEGSGKGSKVPLKLFDPW